MTQALASAPFYEIHATLSDGRIVSVAMVQHGALEIKRLVIGKSYAQVPDILASILAVCTEAHRVAALGAIEQAIGETPSDDVKRRRATAVLRERLLNGLWRLAIEWPRALGLPEQPTLVAAAKRLMQAAGPSEARHNGLQEIIALAGNDTLMQAMTKTARLTDGSRQTELLAERIAGARNDPRAVLAGLTALSQGNAPMPEWTGSGGVVRTARGILIHTVSLAVDRIADYAVITPTDRIMAPGGLGEMALLGLGGPDLAACAHARMALVDPCTETEIRLVEAAHA